MDAGHTVPYDSIKMQTEALVNAFGADSEAGVAMLQRFDDLEARLEDVRAQLEGKTVMVLQSSPPTPLHPDQRRHARLHGGDDRPDQRL